ncbi:MAG: hypothetical protein ACMXYG_01560 [Candidatus Woesearchaeota archaeon]
MDESGKITKKNLIKGALILTASTISTKKVKSQLPTGSTVTDSDGNERIVSGDQCMHTVPESYLGHAVYFARGGEIIGTCCNAPGHPLPGETSNKGNDRAIWWCTRFDCTWKCKAENNNDVCSSGRHSNSGSIEISGVVETDHINNIQMTHERDTRTLRGTHNHHGYHSNFNEICDQSDPPHNNHCSHGSHTSW